MNTETFWDIPAQIDAALGGKRVVLTAPQKLMYHLERRGVSVVF